ncbi:MAG: 30S ribosomal protein S3 [Patescibacteria group bacterium]|nr:30S ribosomal protein S3 [Patescibacteria group bacterium]
MGHKVHPTIFRIKQLYTWKSNWFARKKDFQKFLQEDSKIRKFLKKKLRNAGVDSISIERMPANITIVIHTAKPGMIIGRGGQGAEELKKNIIDNFFKNQKNQDRKKLEIKINIQEFSKPALSATITAELMSLELEKRVPYRRVLKQTLDRIEKAGAKGAKVMIKGRLNGAEIARTEHLSWGRIPLHNLRADIDYSRAIAYTTYGTIGIKVWIYKGEVFKK